MFTHLARGFSTVCVLGGKDPQKILITQEVTDLFPNKTLALYARLNNFLGGPRRPVSNQRSDFIYCKAVPSRADVLFPNQL